MANGVTCFSSLRVLSEFHLEILQEGCDVEGYIPFLCRYLKVQVDEPERLKDIARDKFLTLPASHFDRFFTLRVWLRAFETYFRFEKPFYFPHFDPHVLSQNKE